MMRIEDITSEEFRAYAERGATVIVPLGATESHGPHLPLGTDSFQPEHIAMEVAMMRDDVLVAPTMPYGQHSTAKNVPGTIAISFDAVRAVVTDILESLIRHGIRRIIVISGHAGNSHMTAVTEACRYVAESDDVEIIFFSDFQLAAECGICGEDDGHAGLAETSRMLDIRPDLVKDARPSGRYRSFGYKVIGDASLCMPEGVVGDTEGASADIGKIMNDHIIERILKMLP